MKYFILLLFLLSTSAFSKAVEVKTKKPSVKFHSLKEVCSAFDIHHVLLATPVGATRVDCMGKVVSVSKFCKKKYPDNKRLLRGVINFEEKATCHFAESTIVTLDCSAFPRFCKKASTGCKSLKSVYAINHVVIYSSLIEEPIFNENKKLRCYYAFTDQI